jgi:hypothetical protein
MNIKHIACVLQAKVFAADGTFAGLRRSVHVPVLYGGKRTTPATRTSLSLLEQTLSSAAGNFLEGGLLNEAGISTHLGSTFGSFYASDAQTGSFCSDIMQEGQRVRGLSRCSAACASGSVTWTFSSITSPTAIYTASQQSSERETLPASFTVNAYQISSRYGRGRAARAVI